MQIDGGPWMPATIDRRAEAAFAWKIWSLEWEKPTPGEHTITSRAIDTAGHIQPAMNDPRIAKKRTYWESNTRLEPALPPRPGRFRALVTEGWAEEIVRVARAQGADLIIMGTHGSRGLRRWGWARPREGADRVGWTRARLASTMAGAPRLGVAALGHPRVMGAAHATTETLVQRRPFACPDPTGSRFLTSSRR